MHHFCWNHTIALLEAAHTVQVTVNSEIVLQLSPGLRGAGGPARGDAGASASRVHGRGSQPSLSLSPVLVGLIWGKITMMRGEEKLVA